MKNIYVIQTSKGKYVGFFSRAEEYYEISFSIEECDPFVENSISLCTYASKKEASKAIRAMVKNEYLFRSSNKSPYMHGNVKSREETVKNWKIVKWQISEDK